MEIITGYKGEPHVESAQDRAVHQAIVGEGSYILDVGNNLSAEVVSANEIRIHDGVLSQQGCFGAVANGTYDALAIANGSQGMLRKDLIVCRYTKTGRVENQELVVIQGTPSASNPAVPACNTGTIADGDSPVDFPLYVVNISGISVTGVERVAEIRGLAGRLDDLEERLDGIDTEIAAIQSDMGEVKMKAVSKTVTIPDGYTRMTETTVDFTDVLPTNASLIGVDVTFGNFHMPYSRDGASIGTWVSRMYAKSIVVNNTVGVYQNYTMLAVLFYVEGNA